MRILRVAVLVLLLVAGSFVAPPVSLGYSVCYGCAGWDGPGLGSATLSYHFGALTHDFGLTDSLITESVRSAMRTWSSVAAIGWVETSLASQPRSVDIDWGSGTYGPYEASFPSGALAVAYYPSPPNFDPLAGNIYFNDAYSWAVNGSGIDIFSVALHELGHALGLGHSTVADSVMYPYYHRVAGLNTDDVAGILSLYAAAQTSSPSPAPQPSTTSFGQANPSPVPEPGTLLLLGSGLIGLVAWVCRRTGRARTLRDGAKLHA